MKVLSPLGLFRLMASIYKYGMNVMTLLSFAEKTYGNNVAFVYEKETLSYKQLFDRSEEISTILFKNYQLKRGQKVGFLCRNHPFLVQSLFAVSRLGANVYLLNPEMSRSQIQQIIDRHDFDMIVYDGVLSAMEEELSNTKAKVMAYHNHYPVINNLIKMDVNEKPKLNRTSMSKLVLLTGGTTGKSKEVAHKPSIFTYLNPFLGLLTRLKLLHYQTVYIATPIYHGYGLAVLFLFLALGKKVVISKGFDAEKSCGLIREHKVEIVTVVPLMIHKMLKYNAKDLRSLVCIASGSAELNPKLVTEISSKLGDVLYNLYGTSEAGLNIIATPQDLKYSAYTLGKKIKGVRLYVLDNQKKKVEVGSIGQFCIKNTWSIRKRKYSWIETGDLGYQDLNGYYFLSGRTDDLVVSAGVNVYPIELEQVLINHRKVEAVAVIGMRDEKFGQRLKAFVHPVKHSNLTKEEIYEWLYPRVARYQIPKEIVLVDQMPYTPLGKLDKKQFK